MKDERNGIPWVPTNSIDLSKFNEQLIINADIIIKAACEKLREEIDKILIEKGIQ